MVSQVRGRCNICGEKDLRTALVQKMQTDIISCRLTPQIRAHYLIAQQCGYADTSNFIRVFKKYYGISPVEYRAAQGGAE